MREIELEINSHPMQGLTEKEVGKVGELVAEELQQHGFGRMDNELGVHTLIVKLDNALVSLELTNPQDITKSGKAIFEVYGVYDTGEVE